MREFCEYQECKYKDYVQVFIDGSKDPDGWDTSSAVVVPKYKTEICRGASYCLSVSTVKLCAILMALEWVERNAPRQITICSDSVSALYSLMSGINSGVKIAYMKLR